MENSTKCSPDWETVKRDYRAGILSLRAIAEREGISHTAISKRAKKESWERDLKRRVIAAAQNMVVRDIGYESVSTHSFQPLRACADGNQEKEVIEVTATAIANCLRDHRRDIRQGRQIVRRLIEELEDLGDISIRHALVEIAAQQSELQGNEKVQRLMDRALSLSNRASVVRDLVAALKTAIELERQALQVDNPPQPEPEKPLAEKTIVPMIDLQFLISKIRGQNESELVGCTP